MLGFSGKTHSGEPVDLDLCRSQGTVVLPPQMPLFQADLQALQANNELLQHTDPLRLIDGQAVVDKQDNNAERLQS